MSFGFGFSRPANFYGGYLWTPARISTALWLDAADATTITLNGTTVSQWNDKSGNGRNASQSTASNQPTYSLSGFNSRPTLDFDGGDFMRYSASMFSVENVTLLCVFQEKTQKTFAGVMSIHASTGNDENVPNAVTLVTAGPSDYVWAGANSVFSVISGSGVAPASVWAYRKTTTNVTAYRNATASTTNAVTANGTANGGYIIANRWQTGAPGGTLVMLDGRISEIVALSRAVTNDEFDKLNGYLAWKWGGF